MRVSKNWGGLLLAAHPDLDVHPLGAVVPEGAIHLVDAASQGVDEALGLSRSSWRRTSGLSTASSRVCSIAPSLVTKKTVRPLVRVSGISMPPSVRVTRTVSARENSTGSTPTASARASHTAGPRNNTSARRQISRDGLRFIPPSILRLLSAQHPHGLYSGGAARGNVARGGRNPSGGGRRLA